MDRGIQGESMSVVRAASRVQLRHLAAMFVAVVVTAWLVASLGASCAFAGETTPTLSGWVGDTLTTMTADGAHTVTATVQMGRGTSSTGDGFYGLTICASGFETQTVVRAHLYRDGVLMRTCYLAHNWSDPITGASQEVTPGIACSVDLSYGVFPMVAHDYSLVFLDSSLHETTGVVLPHVSFPRIPCGVQLAPVYAGYKACIRVSVGDEPKFNPRGKPLSAYVTLYRGTSRVGRYLVPTTGWRDVPVTRNMSALTYRAVVETADAMYRTTSFAKALTFPKPHYYLSLSRTVTGGRGYVCVGVKTWTGAAVKSRKVTIYRAGKYAGAATTDRYGRARLAVSKNRSNVTFKASLPADATHLATSREAALNFSYLVLTLKGVGTVSTTYYMKKGVYHVVLTGTPQLVCSIYGPTGHWALGGNSGVSRTLTHTAAGKETVLGRSWPQAVLGGTTPPANVEVHLYWWP